MGTGTRTGLEMVSAELKEARIRGCEGRWGFKGRKQNLALSALQRQKVGSGCQGLGAWRGGGELESDGDGISDVQDGKLCACGFTARQGVNPAELPPENR